jgi:polyphenol oxidase
MRSSIDGSRRTFLRQVMAASLGLTALPREAFGQACKPPGDLAKPVTWSGDHRAVQPRRPATSLTVAEATKLKAAYKALRDLATSDPSDPRGWLHQANVHCYNCGGGGGQIHGTQYFFAWHRAELYFHEKILGKLVGDTNFRLPYWNWEDAVGRKMPAAYTGGTLATNSLIDTTRDLLPTEDIPTDIENQTEIDTLLTTVNFSTFQSAIEGGCHGAVHVAVNGDMGAFSTAAKDPIFYSHHSNVDKMWSDWNKVGHASPSDATFLNKVYHFFDENKKWTAISVKDVLDHEKKLKYIYGASRMIKPFDISKLKLRKMEPLVLEQDKVRVSPTLRDSVIKSVEVGRQVALHVERIEVPAKAPGIYRIYADPAAAAADKGPRTPGYLGYVAVVPNSRDHADHDEFRPSALLNLTKTAIPLLRDRSELTLTMVLLKKGGGAQPVPLKAQGVSFLLER